MTRFFFALAAIFFSPTIHAQDFVHISTDKASYAAGETAQVRLRFLSVPESPGFEFYLSAKIDYSTAEIKKITDLESYSLIPNLIPGSHTFSVETF